MKKIRTLIVEDEPRSRNVLRNMIQEFCPDIELVGEASDLEQAEKAIFNENPELVFLDINLFGESSLKLLEKLRRLSFEIVFTTAYDKFAIDAFRFDACDFLLKPIGPADLKNALGKVKRRLQGFAEVAEEAHTDYKKIPLPTLHGIEYQDTNSILYVKADGNYSTLYFSNGDKKLVSQPIQHYENILSSETFFRVHKSYMVNLIHVIKYLKGRGGHVVLSNQDMLPVASRRKTEFLNLIGN